MPFSDSTLTCRTCHTSFLWTAGEQAFFKAQGLMNMPLRCVACRADRRKEVGLRSQPVTEVRCAECGVQTTVPFVPRNGKPIYCSPCFTQVRARDGAEELVEATSPDGLEPWTRKPNYGSDRARLAGPSGALLCLRTQ
jgi:CxxC-x17-CxxC domain-containing protein